jgi:hypothetical protein
MSNKTSIFLWWLFKLPFKVLFNLVGVLVLVLTAFFFGIIGKK